MARRPLSLRSLAHWAGSIGVSRPERNRRGFGRRIGMTGSHRTEAAMLAVEPLEERRLLAVGAEMLADIDHDIPAGVGIPSDLVQAGSVVYFDMNDGIHGYELWKTDGSSAQMVRDIYPGSVSGDPHYKVNVNGTLYFAANSAGYGFELWVTDGTSSGTRMVRDIRPGNDGSSPSNLTNVNGVLYFSTFGAAGGQYGLWKSDGTSAGTVQLHDFNPGVGSGRPLNLTAVGSTLYFMAKDNVATGQELWKSNGTSSGTVLVRDINPGSAGGGLAYLANASGKLMFLADDGVAGREPWVSNGTSTGTTLVKDVNPGPASSVILVSPEIDGFEVVGNTVYFTATNGASGYELWKSNGTSSGTVQVRDIRPGIYSSFPSFQTNVNGTLYFGAHDGINGFEAWKSNGTSTGTTLVAVIQPGSTYARQPSSINAGGTLYFKANDGVAGYELWKSNGTSSGTVRVSDIYVGAGSAFDPNSATFQANLGTTLFFVADDGVHGPRLWKTDGSSSGTQRVDYEVQLYTPPSNPSQFTDVAGVTFFVANDGAHGYELWKTYGGAGTQLVKDIVPGTGDPNIGFMTEAGGKLFFRANDGVNGAELWVSDGTSGGTHLVKDIFPGFSIFTPNSSLSDDDGFRPVNVNGVLFFPAVDGTGLTLNSELWRSDGTSDGTWKVAEIIPNAILTAGSYPHNLTNVNGTLFFSANEFINLPPVLFRSDGTSSGTALVSSAPRDPSQLTNVNGTLFFTANDGVTGQELWTSNGTSTGTQLVKDIRPGSASSDIVQLTNVSGTLMFAANDGTQSYGNSQLWTSNGTSTGTTKVRADVFAYALGPSHTLGSNLVNVNGALYFAAVGGESMGTGIELWRSDGTSTGTVLVKDIKGNQSFNISSWPQSLTNVGGKLYFSASDDTHGTELWRSDGTSAGTVLVEDIHLAPDTAFNPPKFLANANGMLIFSADDGVHGFEPWIIGPPPTAIISGDTNGYRGELLSFTFTAVGGGAVPTDTVTYHIDWNNDGIADQSVSGLASGITVSHAFFSSTNPGVFVRVENERGIGASTARQIFISDYALRPNADNPALMDLVWGGSDGDDSVVFTQLGSGVIVQKLMDNGVAMNVSQLVSLVTGRVIAYGNPGNDTLNALGLSTKSATLDGGAGNNTLHGGSGGDILIGGTDGAEGGGHHDGSNVIIAGNGTNTIYGNAPIGKKDQIGGDNLIIGGTGSDTIYGNYGVNNQPLADGGEGGHNILIGGTGADAIYTTQSADGAEGSHGSIAIAGTTTYGNSPAGIAALQSILAEWSSGHATSAKLAFIQGTGGPGGLNGANYLTAGGTVLSDVAVDTIFGDTNGSAHWFFYRLSQDLLSRDKTSDIKSLLP